MLSSERVLEIVHVRDDFSFLTGVISEAYSKDFFAYLEKKSNDSEVRHGHYFPRLSALPFQAISFTTLR